MSSQAGDGRHGWLAAACIVWTIILGGIFLAVPAHQILAMPDASMDAAVSDIPPVPTAPPQPTAPPPPTEDHKVLGPGDQLDHRNDWGIEIINRSCPTSPLTVTVGVYPYNPMTATYPITGPFQAYDRYWNVRATGANDTDPTCLHSLTAQFCFPLSATQYSLFYWNPLAELWQRVGIGPLLQSYDVCYNTTFLSDSVPSLMQLDAGLVFAWGYTKTGHLVSNDVYLPIIMRNYSRTQ